jgi:hypothetical protein
MHFRTIPPSLPDTGGQRLPEGREPLALQKGNALNDFAPQPDYPDVPFVEEGLASPVVEFLEHLDNNPC